MNVQDGLVFGGTLLAAVGLTVAFGWWLGAVFSGITFIWLGTKKWA